MNASQVVELLQKFIELNGDCECRVRTAGDNPRMFGQRVSGVKFETTGAVLANALESNTVNGHSSIVICILP